MCDRPPGLFEWAFRPRNPMKNRMPELHGTASVSESDVTFALGCRPLADARGSVGRFLSGPPIPPSYFLAQNVFGLADDARVK
jgi:hypothetical protein